MLTGYGRCYSPFTIDFSMPGDLIEQTPEISFLLPVLAPSGSVTAVNFALYSNIEVSVHQFH